nr:conserved hypothetical protein [Vibrio chagasii]
MSKYEKENGTLIFSKTGFSKLSSNIRKAFNEYQMAVYNEAVKFHALSHKPADSDALRVFLENKYTVKTYSGHKDTCPVALFDLYEFIMTEVYRSTEHSPADETFGICTQLVKAYKPRKSMVPSIKSNVKQFTIEIPFTEAQLSVTPSSTGGSIEWDVTHGNKSVTKAHQNPLAISIFNQINAHEWKRKEGGVINYSNEYGEATSKQFGKQ